MVAANNRPSTPSEPDIVEPELDAAPEDELLWRLRQQKLLSSFGLFAVRCMEEMDLLSEATRRCAEGMNVEFCKYLEPASAEADTLLVRAGVGWHDGVVGVATVGMDLESPAGYAFRTHQPVISNHLPEETRFRTPSLFVEHGIRRALNVPVRDETAPIGVLEVDSTRAGKFSGEDIAFVEGMANLLAVALDRLRTTRRLAEVYEREKLITREMHHRIKNFFSVVGGLISMSEREARKSGDAESAVPILRERIAALARSSELGLRAAKDQLEANDVNAATFTGSVLSPYAGRFRVDGPEAVIEARLTTPLALLLHELATNSLKHGAFGEETGFVTVTWTATEHATVLDWVETGGPRIEAPPEELGFGSSLVQGILASVGGSFEVDWAETGVRAQIRFATA